ncbi:glycoside hydrolase family 15 protein [Streptomyces virginiae]|uniref:glycoside hydrolase family 15 protein n=1 Tax=Streptomyces TaxID=1883 RepID=UPI000524CCBD|nr:MULTISPECIES: glycoside hydrolase family 15 protein [Streptomyces]MCX4718225.1 glycoside hydrolase family 15 protein [Streptomyces virginiae]WSX97067.1 glycoside hydrolase family 15 protein [Streptomyces goshikiensis]
MNDSVATAPTRLDGYAELRDYAAIGDGRCVALIARDGAVDWLSWPDLDSSTLFAAVLDQARGGSFLLRPDVPHTVARRYLPGTNVLETTFTTAGGTVRVTDALTLPDTASLAPGRELVRRIEGLSGSVPMSWSVQPRFGYGARIPIVARRAGVPVAVCGAEAVAVCAWDAGHPQCTADSVTARFRAESGTRALIALPYAYQEPLVLPTRAECEARLDHTTATWRQWSDDRTYTGPWRDAVLRSALALKLLVFAPSGAVAAAATCSLPEELGGERNWDYRFSWIRDSAFTLDAFLKLGCAPEATSYLWWLMHASQLTHPHLNVLYRLNGGTRAPEQALPLSGYRGSTPVRVGNAAAGQVQLDTYGELLQTAWLYTTAGHRLDADIARRLAETADFVCTIWQQPDAGIWEVRSSPEHFTQSKMMCWIALDRAVDLARRQLIPDRHSARWQRERQAIAEFVETRCFSERLNSYMRSAGSDDLDASLLLGLLHGYRPQDDGRLRGTVSAVQETLREGPYVSRYLGSDGVPGREGAFLACSFWLAEALAGCGRIDEAVSLMDQLVALGNGVGLYSEEIDPTTGAFLGNMPQGLSHLALISAACAIGEATR